MTVMNADARTNSNTNDAAPSKGLHYGLWGVQVLLALAFGMAGFMKSTSPLEQLGQMLPWVPATPGAVVRFIGISELAGGIGMILPAATRIMPSLTPLAGAGLATVMALASVFHVSRGEFGALPINFVLGGMALFVAWGRSRKAPIAARS